MERMSEGFWPAACSEPLFSPAPSCSVPPHAPVHVPMQQAGLALQCSPLFPLSCVLPDMI